MRLSVIAHPVAGHGPLRRVLVPADRMRNTWVLSPAYWRYGMMTSSRADLLRIGALVRLAAISPHSAVHIPLRDNDTPDDVEWWFQHRTPVDLLFVRKDVGIRPSAWPDVRTSFRRRTHAAKRITVRTPEPRPPSDLRDWNWSKKDSLVTNTEHAATLLLTGSSVALHQVADVITAAGEQIASNSRIRSHGQNLLGTLSPLLVEPGWGHEIDIYGRDPIFHKRRWQATSAPAGRRSAPRRTA